MDRSVEATVVGAKERLLDALVRGRPAQIAALCRQLETWPSEVHLVLHGVTPGEGWPGLPELYIAFDTITRDDGELFSNMVVGVQDCEAFVGGSLIGLLEVAWSLGCRVGWPHVDVGLGEDIVEPTPEALSEMWGFYQLVRAGPASASKAT